MIWTEFNDEPLQAGQVLIRHTAIGVNFIDTYYRSGLYPLPLPARIGSEAVGVIEAVGAEVKNWSVGDRVGYCTGVIGSYAQFITVSPEKLIAIPDFLSDLQAASILLKGLTAAYLLHDTFTVTHHHTLLWHAAAGGVGLLACQWASAKGARVIGTVGSRTKANLALARGCSEVILYQEQEFSSEVRRLTDGQGVDVVYDSVGKTTFDGSLNSLKARGMMVSFGNASGAVEPISPLQLMQSGSLYLTRPTLSHYASDPQALRRLANNLFNAISLGQIKVDEGRSYPLQKAAQAHKDLSSRVTTGSIVLIP